VESCFLHFLQGTEIKQMNNDAVREGPVCVSRAVAEFGVFISVLSCLSTAMCTVSSIMAGHGTLSGQCHCFVGQKS
jgi:hypothetical protein